MTASTLRERTPRGGRDAAAGTWRRVCRGNGLLLALGVLAGASPVHAAGPDALPDALWWGARAAMPLAEAPLQLEREPVSFVLQSTWWPLYSDGRGARVEGERHRMRMGTALGPARAALELLQDARTLEGGSGAFTMDARERFIPRATWAAAWSGARFSGAAALSLPSEGAPGFAFGAAVRPVKGWETEWRAVHLAGRGVLGVRWNEESVAAPADWTDRTLEWSLRGGAGATRITLGLLGTNRVAASGGERDRAEPSLAWREASGAMEFGAAGARVTLAAWQGSGRQSTIVSRGGTPYARAVGPVRNSGLSFAAGPRSGGGRARAWAGRWAGDASGMLAYWPFQSLAGLMGTRRIAESEADLRHAGLALERETRSGLGWGLAVWGVAPSARARSWQATLFGIGRDDYSESAVTLQRALLAGVRLAPAVRCGAGRARLALVQWVPVRVWREAGAGGGAGPSTGGSGATGGDAPMTRGGTVIELTLER